jgi:hypothetical protein
MLLPENTPPPVGPRGLAIRCALQGADAYAAGQPVNASPYGAPRPFSRRAWLVGYLAAARAAGAVLPGDEVLEDNLDHDAPTPTP